MLEEEKAHICLTAEWSRHGEHARRSLKAVNTVRGRTCFEVALFYALYVYSLVLMRGGLKSFHMAGARRAAHAVATFADQKSLSSAGPLSARPVSVKKSMNQTKAQTPSVPKNWRTRSPIVFPLEMPYALQAIRLDANV